MCLSEYSPDAVLAHFVHLRAFPVSSCTRDMHSRSTSTQAYHQVSRQTAAHLIIHPCSRIVEQIVDVPVPQNPGTHCHWITSQMIGAWQRRCDSMTTNMAEVLKLAARPTPYDKDERTWLEFRFKIENNLTNLNEKYVTLLQDAESQPVANVPAGTDEASALIRTLSHTHTHCTPCWRH